MRLENIEWSKYKKQIIIGVIILLLVLFGGIYFVHASSVPNEVEEVEETENISNEVVTEEETNSNAEKVLVDVKGAVANPGVYQLSVGCSVQDAIYMAGGLLESANTKVINLSKRVVDEMVIIVYTNEEIEEYQKDSETVTEFVYVEMPCECPDAMNDACITENKETENKDDELISINTATKEELMTLPGVGESKANTIIAYREEHGSFKEIEDIMNVSGIGESAFEKIKDKITI